MATLIRIRATVITGKRSVGMLSLMGSKPRVGNQDYRPESLARGRTSASGLVGSGLREGLLGVVARPHERPRRHRLEPHGVRPALELGELVRMPVAHHGEVVAGGPQVL